ncbi:hypothetical protein [Aliidiomarina soli]|nr:hypothetical protein [Aliidiomarina soli]
MSNKPMSILLAFVIAVLVAAVLGTIFQTQLNLAAMGNFGPPISFSMRLSNTWHDLRYFGPLYLAIIACTFLVSFSIAELVARLFPGQRIVWLTLAAVVGLWLCFQVIDALAPMPTFIAATRGIGGTLIMLLAAAIGAVTYTLLSSPLNAPEDQPGDAENKDTENNHTEDNKA